ncbi:MAG: hypothetical protein QNJ72_02485 [Pleurocapsa sp. MO_226.B13]|nr:hypothetical protein [Pleurocapsa sp. MO_226.B13]
MQVNCRGKKAKIFDYKDLLAGSSFLEGCDRQIWRLQLRLLPLHLFN